MTCPNLGTTCQDACHPDYCDEQREMKVRVKLWFCPNDGWPYPDRKWHRVEWDDDLATCLDCGRNNRDTEV